MKVFGPKPIGEITEGYFGPNGVLSHDLRARTELGPSQEVWLARGGTLPRPWPAPILHEITPGFALDQGDWRIEAIEVPHAQPFLTCLAFAVISDGKRIVYSGDAGHSKPLETLAQGADLLVHWCYRLDGDAASPEMAALTPAPSEIGAMARRAGCKQLVLSHFRKSMDRDDGPLRAIAAAQKAFDGPVQVAEDLMEIEV
jgi:ribonuclease BN (tRNA processing enzyme)